MEGVALEGQAGVGAAGAAVGEHVVRILLALAARDEARLAAPLAAHG